MKLKEFNNAVKLLETYIEMKSYGVPYSVCDNAPSTYKELVESYEANRIFFVNGEASDKTIYSKKRYNIMFRAIHDSMHYKHKLSFKFEDEKKLSYLTEVDFKDWAIEHGYMNFCPMVVMNVYKIIHAEIAGQIEYYEKHGKYVDDQKAYVMEYVGVV